jgi:hypothetical protein
VVFNVYVARSGAGIGVGVDVKVAVGMGVKVGVGDDVTVGVAVGAGAKVEHAERRKVKRKIVEMIGVNLFRMGSILPLVVKISEPFDEKFRKKRPVGMARRSALCSEKNYPSIFFFNAARAVS